ncbi:methylmalonyl-CoA epimerase [bacterium]|nr:methylmalonyl-CoA epimerase [bacterium]MBU1636311.1 methylmalonyl-CoA epimerase [bacterium]MBU1919567.1 methylmalonyl-CoA epimerase [bacterium]
MIKGLDHIAVAVSDLDAAVKLWTETFQVAVSHREIIQDQLVEVAMIKLGSLHVELISPISSDSPVAKFIEKRGEALHHFAVASESTQDELDRMKQSGIPLIDEMARAGAKGSRIGFIHPQALGGVLVEIVDHQKE